jgi:hypothetical protein
MLGSTTRGIDMSGRPSIATRRIDMSGRPSIATRRIDMSGRPTRDSTPSIPTRRGKTTHALAACAALWFVTTVVFGGLFAWASLRDPTDSETCHGHQSSYDGRVILGHDSFVTMPNDGDCCSHSHSDANYCGYKANATTCVHYIGTTCSVSKPNGRRLSETSEESVHLKLPSPPCSAPSPGICVHDVRNWTTHRHLHANLSAQEQHLFANHDSSHAHRYTDCTYAANASELVYRPDGKVNVSSGESGSGESGSGESGSGEVTEINEHGSLNQTGNHCISSVITYKVPIDEILSLDFEHTLVSVEMDIRPRRPSTCPPDVESCRCNDGDDPCGPGFVEFEHGSFIRIGLSVDTCRKSSWKYANVYTGDNRQCYTIEEIDSHNLTITYNVTGTADCIDGFARTHSDDQAQPINDTILTSRRLFDHRGKCVCKRDCIFGYELCADTSECERICQQESMDEYLQEHQESRASNSRSLHSSHTGKLKLVKMISQHLISREMVIDGIKVTFTSGLVIQAFVDVVYKYGWIYFHVEDITRHVGLTLYKPTIQASFDLKGFVAVPDVGFKTGFKLFGMLNVDIAAQVGMYVELKGHMDLSVDFYHVGTNNGEPTSTKQPFPCGDFLEYIENGCLDYANPLPKFLLSPVILYDYLGYNYVDWTHPGTNLDLENYFDLDVEIEGTLILGLVAGVKGKLHFWWWHYYATAGIMAGAVLKLSFEEELRVKLWSKDPEPEVEQAACLRMMIGLMVGAYLNLNGHAHVAADYWSLYEHTWGRCPADHQLPVFDSKAQKKLIGEEVNTEV